MCAQIFHMVNTDVPAGVGAPPLDTTPEATAQLILLVWWFIIAGREREQAAHWLTNLSLHKTGFVTHK